MWFQQVLDYIGEFNTVSVILRIIMAMLFGSLMGLDRTKKRRPAGFRTYSLVCVGAALTMLIGQYMINVQGINSDPARIGAQVVSGVGFLGAGTILLKSKNHVVGLTTAAGLWASACLGLAIGVGFYLGAIVGLLAVIFIVTFMHRINDSLIKKAKVLSLYVELMGDKNFGSVIQTLKNEGVYISEMENVSGREGGLITYLLVLRLNKQCKLSHENIIDIFTNSDGILFCEEII
jgi:putative Mg2+ transporter-C (MgtC) family protein